MKKLLVTALFLSIIGVSSAVAADTKIAIVDVQELLSKSSQVQALKKENEAKGKELQKWLKNAQSEIAKQTTQEGKEKLIKKYDEELKKKQEANKKVYIEKLSKIDKSITSTIVNQAKMKGYDLVLTKQGAVIYGGLDITDDLAKVVK